jgi:hypothetical protein
MPADLRDRFGIAVARTSSNDPAVEPILLQLDNPAAIQASRTIESRFVTETWPVTTSGESAAAADALSQTITALGEGTVGANLVRFLAGREAREARIDAIVTEFYGRSISKGNRKTARRRAELTRRALDDKGCPLRLTIRRSVVRLIDG